MRHFLDGLVAHKFAELLDLFLMATRAEVALFAAEGDEVIVSAVVAMQSSQATTQVTTDREGVECLCHLWPQPAVLLLEASPILFK